VYIKSLIIRNFRNFNHAVFQFCPKLTILVGENGCGKSNALYALRLLFDASLNKQARTLDEDDFHDPTSIQSGNEILIAAILTDFEGNSKDLAYCAKWKVSADTALVAYRFRPNETARQEAQDTQQAALEAGEVPEPKLFTIDDYEYERCGGSPGIPLQDLTINDDFPKNAEADLNKYLVVELPAIRDVVRDMALRRQSPLVKLIELAALPSTVKADVEQIVAKANADIRADPFFQKLESQISSAYADLAVAPEALTVHIGLADPSFAAALRSISLLITDSALEDADVSRNSLGFNNLLYIALLSEYFERRKADRPSNQLLIVEEPEAHLHPNAQAALMRRLQNNDHQTIATTHSLVTTGTVGIDPLITVTHKQGGSTAQRLRKAAKLNAAEERDLIRYLDSNRASLLFARTVILVEGISEDLLIRAIARSRGIDLAQRNVAVTPVAGTFFRLFERLFASGAIPSDCVIVTDGDAQNDAKWLKAGEPDDGAPVTTISAAANVHWHQCRTTLEMTIAQPENADWIANAFLQLDYPRVSQNVYDRLLSGNSKKIQLAQLQTLRNARRSSKGRFAQLLALSIESAVLIPPYLDSAIQRITS
jgi:putative ATP-dependent endonuclease of the OLD family